MILAVGLSYMAFMVLRHVPFISSLLRIIIMQDVVFVTCFLFIYQDDYMTFIFHCLMQYITYIHLQCVEPSLHPRDKSYLIIVCIILLMCSRIRFANILLRNFASMLNRDGELQFSFPVSLSDFGIKIMLASSQHWEISSVLCDHLEGWDREGGREGDARGKRYGNICICITDSLCYKAETNTPL